MFCTLKPLLGQYSHERVEFSFIWCEPDFIYFDAYAQAIVSNFFFFSRNSEERLKKGTEQILMLGLCRLVQKNGCRGENLTFNEVNPTHYRSLSKPRFSIIAPNLSINFCLLAFHNNGQTSHIPKIHKS